jgi:hypothetical protein
MQDCRLAADGEWGMTNAAARSPPPAALEQGDVACGFVSASCGVGVVCVVSALLQPFVEKETEATRLDDGGFFDVG